MKWTKSEEKIEIVWGVLENLGGFCLHLNVFFCKILRTKLLSYLQGEVAEIRGKK